MGCGTYHGGFGGTDIDSSKMLKEQSFNDDDDEVLMHAGRLQPKAEGG